MCYISKLLITYGSCRDIFHQGSASTCKMLCNKANASFADKQFVNIDTVVDNMYTEDFLWMTN